MLLPASKIFQRKSQKDMEYSGDKDIETGNNAESVNNQMVAIDRRNLTLEEIIKLNKKESDESLRNENKNNDEKQTRFKDYLKFSIEIAKAIEKAEENKGWDRRPVEIYMPEGKSIILLIGGETTDRDIAKTLDKCFGENCLVIGVRNKRNRVKESVIERKIEDLEKEKKVLGIIFA